MKCLSVSQPFADLIIHSKKTIELRRWNTSFRGEFLIHSPKKIRVEDCKRLGINPKNLVKGAIIGKAEIYDVKKYNSKSEIIKDSKKHHASKSFQNNKYGFCLKNAMAFRVPIPTKGQLGFFEVKLEQKKIKKSEIIADLIDEEYRYQWIGHH
jgi:predicted transcriptional regulator